MRVPTKTPLVNVPQGDQTLRHGLDLAIPARSGGADSAAFDGGGLLGSLSQGLDDVSRATRQIALEVASKEAQARADEAFSSMGGRLNGFLYGENGIYTRKGQNAVGAVQETRDFLEKSVLEGSQGLSPAAAGMFKDQANRLRFTTMGAVARHAGLELENWRCDSLLAAARTSQQAALSAYNDDRQWNENKLAGLDKYDEWMLARGAGEQERALRLADLDSELDMRRIALFAEKGDYAGGLNALARSGLNEQDRARAAGGLEGAYLDVLLRQALESPQDMLEKALSEKDGANDGRRPLEPEHPLRLDDLVSREGWARLAAAADAELKRRETLRGQAAATLAAGADDCITQGMRSGDYSKLRELEENLQENGHAAQAQDLAEMREVLGLAGSYLLGSDSLPLADQGRYGRGALENIRTGENSEKISRAGLLLEREILRRENSFQADPAGYVAKHPLLSEEGLSGRERVRRGLELQRQIGRGMPFQARALARREAADIRDSYAAAPDYGQKAKLLRELAGDHGKYSTLVLAEAGLPAGLSALGPVLAGLAQSDCALLIRCLNEAPEGQAQARREQGRRRASQSSLYRSLTLLRPS